jgi:hypothetical protein
MSNFKILLIVLSLFMASCFPIKESPPTADRIGALQILVYDGCEYLAYRSFAGATELTHKGNCKFCTQRRIPLPSYQISNAGKNWKDYRPKLLDYE